MEPIFLNTFSALPANAPANHPHVIDIINTPNVGELSDEHYSGFLRRLRIWDVVATVLHTISPATLQNFLDPHKKNFKLIQTRNATAHKFAILKQDNEVIIGQYEDHTDSIPEVFEWEFIVRCAVTADGGWRVTQASYGLYTLRDWCAVWAGKFMALLPTRASVAEDEASRQGKAAQLALNVLCECPWGAEGFSSVVEWS